MPIITGLVGSKIALAALALAALGGGGAAVAAAAGALPTPSAEVQQADPTATSTPEAEPTDTPQAPETHDPVGPDVTGAAAFGLCTAYLAGGVAEGSTPSDALIAAAGEDGVEGYCELIVATHPGSQSGDHGKPADAGKPDELPAQSDQGTSHAPAEQHGR